MKLNKIVFNNKETGTTRTLWKGSHVKIAEMAADELASRGINRRDLFLSSVAANITAVVATEVVGMAVGSIAAGVKAAVQAAKRPKDKTDDGDVEVVEEYDFYEEEPQEVPLETTPEVDPTSEKNES